MADASDEEFEGEDSAEVLAEVVALAEAVVFAEDVALADVVELFDSVASEDSVAFAGVVEFAEAVEFYAAVELPEAVKLAVDELLPDAVTLADVVAFTPEEAVAFRLAGESIAEFEMLTGGLAFLVVLEGILPLSIHIGLASELTALFLQVAFEPLTASPFSYLRGFSPADPTQSGSSTH